MHRRAQMKMTRHERRVNVRTAKFASHEMCARAFPDCMLDVYDRRHQCNEAQILLDHREKRPDPATVAGPENAELAATSVAQRRYQLSDLDHTLTQPLCVANEISRDRQFAVPVATRHPRIMIRQMDETRVPSEAVKVGSPATISDVSCRHERVQHQHRRCAPTALTSEKICASDIAATCRSGRPKGRRLLGASEAIRSRGGCGRSSDVSENSSRNSANRILNAAASSRSIQARAADFSRFGKCGIGLPNAIQIGVRRSGSQLFFE